MKLEGQKVLVVGLGESGKAAARFLAAQGSRVTVTDRRGEAELESAAAEVRALGARLELGAHPLSLFLSQDLIVPSPGVPWDLPELEQARGRGIPVAGELGIARAFLKGPVIGVTGTNGKTTTTSLIGHILVSAGWQARTGGNLGTPVLAMVEGSTEERWNVLELSSFQLEACENFPVHIAVVLNVTPDHLDRHGTFDAYVAAKRCILAAQTSEDYAVLNADDPTCKAFGAAAVSRVCWFSRTAPGGSGARVRDGWITFDGEPVVETELPIRGPHNVENALAAVAATRLAGVPAESVARAVKTFQPVEHRLEFVRSLDGVDYYNDSKATNVDASRKAIEAFDHGLWVILGGRDKDSDFRALAEPLRARARTALLIGESAAKLREHLGGDVPTESLGSLDRAVHYAREHARPGDTVLLAPACASFDQFQNYGQRGRVFKEIVASLS
jgi:UDP-N-acetylmuramoylalanine--D-glutamate ligase